MGLSISDHFLLVLRNTVTQGGELWKKLCDSGYIGSNLSLSAADELSMCKFNRVMQNKHGAGNDFPTATKVTSQPFSLSGRLYLRCSHRLLTLLHETAAKGCYIVHKGFSPFLHCLHLPVLHWAGAGCQYGETEGIYWWTGPWQCHCARPYCNALIPFWEFLLFFFSAPVRQPCCRFKAPGAEFYI